MPSPFTAPNSPSSPRAAARGILATLAILVFAGLPASSSAAATGSEDPARGIQLDGLVADPSCPDGLRVEVPRAPDACTHGPDPAPEGEDVRERRSVPELRAEEEEAQLDAAPELADCIGDGASGDRVELIYARASDRPDRYAQTVSLIQSVAGDMADRMKQSAAESGGSRTLRYVTEGCTVVVRNVVLSTTGDDTLGRTASELAAKGYNRADRKYLTFVDANVYCGIAYAPGNVARVDERCWDGHAGLHELMHNLSAVDPAAPNTSGGYHCTDESDLMCYSDLPNYPSMRQICPTSHEALLDCNGDDYFNTAPRAGTFLSGSPGLNTADSTFVADRDGELPMFLPPAPSGYRGPRYTVRADNADDDLCVYAIRPTTGARVRLFCVGYLGVRSADVTGALVSVAGGADTVELRLIATDRGATPTRAYGFRVTRTGVATPVLDERDGDAGRQSSSAPLGPTDPSTGYPAFYDRALTLALTEQSVAPAPTPTPSGAGSGAQPDPAAATTPPASGQSGPGPSGAGSPGARDSTICRSTRTSLASGRAALVRVDRSLASQTRLLRALKKRLKRGGLTKGEKRRYAAAAKRLEPRRQEQRDRTSRVKRLEKQVASRCK